MEQLGMVRMISSHACAFSASVAVLQEYTRKAAS
jgi:hypothetical protein